MKYSLGLILLFSAHSFGGTNEYCANEWPSDYRMQNHCIEQQREGQNELFRVAKSIGLVDGNTVSASPSGGEQERIVNKCMSEWRRARFDTYDYRMVVHCIDQQLESLAKISGRKEMGEAETGIAAYCADEWPSDYRMREHCEKQQREANHRLFSLAAANGIDTTNGLSVSPTGPGVEPIFSMCMRQWRKERFATYDFRMVVHCLEQN